jgi:hypothetical protein
MAASSMAQKYWLSRLRIAPGASPSRAQNWRALRILPMATAARTPWPTTSPIASMTRPFGSGTTSYQSPPTLSSSLPGT